MYMIPRGCPTTPVSNLIYTNSSCISFTILKLHGQCTVSVIIPDFYWKFFDFDGTIWQVFLRSGYTSLLAVIQVPCEYTFHVMDIRTCMALEGYVQGMDAQMISWNMSGHIFRRTHHAPPVIQIFARWPAWYQANDDTERLTVTGISELRMISNSRYFVAPGVVPSAMWVPPLFLDTRSVVFTATDDGRHLRASEVNCMDCTNIATGNKLSFSHL